MQTFSLGQKLRVRQSDHLNKTWLVALQSNQKIIISFSLSSFCYILDFSAWSDWQYKAKRAAVKFQFTRAYCVILLSYVIFTVSLCSGYYTSIFQGLANKREILRTRNCTFAGCRTYVPLPSSIKRSGCYLPFSISEIAHQLWLLSPVHSLRKQNSSSCFPWCDDFSLVLLAWS